MGLFKKKEVPAELPALAMDNSSRREETLSAIRQNDQLKPISVQMPMQTGQARETGEVQAPKTNSLPTNNEQGYFKNLLKSITEGTKDVKELDSWYKSKFLQEDVVFHMREYWQKQQPQLLLKNISGELKNKLLEKTDRLHIYEKEWQEVYFNLLSKEEQIRKEEKELKDLLSEFMDLHKNFTNRGKRE